MGPKINERLLRKAVKKFKLKLPVMVEITALSISKEEGESEYYTTQGFYTSPGRNQNFHLIQLNRNAIAAEWAYGRMSKSLLHELGHAKQYELGIFKGQQIFAGDKDYSHKAYLTDPIEVGAWRFADRHYKQFKRMCRHTRTVWGRRQFKMIVIQPKDLK